MGIPRLLGHLEPYATAIAFDSPSSNGESRSVVIDGPGLAHHIYNQTITSRRGTRNAIENPPSYKEIGDAFLQWLHNLEAHAISIAAIYFDGALPSFKRDERESRLQQQVTNLRAFKQQQQRLPGARTKLRPPPPFLVAAAIEALYASRFQAITHIVCGEADPHCAGLARQEGHIILTGDSDLVLYDLGSHGSVVYFNELQTQLNLKDKSLCVSGFRPAEIAKELKLATLLPLGYEIKKDYTRSFTLCLTAARDLTLSQAYHAFAREYSAASPAPQGLTYLYPGLSGPPKSPGYIIDPRVSEFVVQAKSERKPGSPIPIYLPFLVEDPDRSAAWEVGRDLRHLAYSILLTGIAHGVPKEHSRRGLRIVTETMNPLSQIDITDSASTLLDVWEKLKSAVGGMDARPQEFWRLFGLYSVCSHYLQQGKDPPNAEVAVQLLRDIPADDWTFIHLNAQLEAALYSIRILQQCTLVYLGTCPEVEQQAAFLKSIKRLHKHMESLPRLTELFPEPNYEGSGGRWTSALQALFGMLDIKHGLPEEQSRTTERKRKKKKGKSDENGSTNSSTMSAVGAQSNNMYSFLNEEF